MFFGRLGDTLGRVVTVNDAASTVADLRRVLAARFPAAAHELFNPGLRACVGDTIVADDHSLAAVGAVDFLPPFSGG